MARPRSEIQRVKDRQVVGELLLKGCNQAQIAQLLEVAPSTICRDVAAIKAEWRQQAMADIYELQQQELERLRLVEHEAWLSWETQKGQGSFNPIFLEVIRRVIGQRAKILGLEANVMQRVQMLTRQNLQMFLESLRSRLSPEAWLELKSAIVQAEKASQ